LKIVGLVVLFALSILLSLTGRSADAPRSGAQIYQTYCGVCHGGGWQGAPVANDKNDWSLRMQQGFDAVLKNAKQGFSTMPPMGTCMDCTDEELTAAIKEMLPY